MPPGCVLAWLLAAPASDREGQRNGGLAILFFFIYAHFPMYLNCKNLFPKQIIYTHEHFLRNICSDYRDYTVVVAFSSSHL